MKNQADDCAWSRAIVLGTGARPPIPLDETAIQVCRVRWWSHNHPAPECGMHMPTLHLTAGAGDAPAHLQLRAIRPADLKDALTRGLSDFVTMPTHIVFLCLIYPVVGLVLARLAFGYDMLPLLFPLMTGFVLIGPFAAIGL